MDITYEDFCKEMCGLYKDKLQAMVILGKNARCPNCIHPEEDFNKWLKEKESIKSHTA